MYIFIQLLTLKISPYIYTYLYSALIFDWGIVVLQRCVSFYCTAK